MAKFFLVVLRMAGVRQKNKKIFWLNGSLTSWKLKLTPQIYNRKFPILKWSVCEDLFLVIMFQKNINFC